MQVKKVCLLIFIVPILSKIQAQEEKIIKDDARPGVITGKVTDSTTHDPLEYATIALFRKGNASPVDGVTSNTSGRFQLVNIGPGSYSLNIDFIGYETYTIPNINITEKKPLVDLKNIFLSPKSTNLSGVTITAPARILENRIDKVVFNAERDLTSQTGVATDVLKKIPQVSVDVDGNVELAGSSSIRFLINGKPSSAFGTNIADVLQAIPASQIKSIEVITNPGARYDAEGIGGIINIILKKNNARGINGNLSLTAGTRIDNGTFNFNARKGKLAISTFLSGHLHPSVTTPTHYFRTSIDSANKVTTLQQDGTGTMRRGGFQTGGSIDYSFDEKNILSANFEYDKFGNKRLGTIDQTQMTTDPVSGLATPNINSLNTTTNKFNYHEQDAGLSYKKMFRKEEQELDIAVNTSTGYYRGVSNNLLYAMPADSLYYGVLGTNPGRENETEISTDYTQPLKKNVVLGMGGKLTLRKISTRANVLSFQPAVNDFLADNYLSDSLTYHQKVFAFYSEISFPVFQLFDAKIGGRYERTEISSYFSNAGQKLNLPGYNTWVPSIYLSRKITDEQQVKFSYSKRIERPDFGDLNPFINTSDPKNIVSGNPYLQSEIGNRYELGYSVDLNHGSSFSVSTFYRTSNHDIQSFLVYYPSLKIGDSVYTNVSVNTRENIGLERDLGMSLFTSLQFDDKLNLRVNLFFFKRHTINAIDPGFNSSSFNIRSNMNFSYQFSKSLAAEFFGNFNSARHELQGKYPSFTSYSFAIRKQFWKKNGSIAFTMVDPFNKYLKQRTLLQGPGFNVENTRLVPFRSFGLNFTWKFGKLEFKKDNEDENNRLNAPE